MQKNETTINLVEAKFCASFLSRALCQSKAVVHHSILIGSASCISARQTYLLLNEWFKFQCQLRNSKELLTFIEKIRPRVVDCRVGGRGTMAFNKKI